MPLLPSPRPLVALLAGCFVVACGGGPDDPPGAASPAGPATAEPTAEPTGTAATASEAAPLPPTSGPAEPASEPQVLVTGLEVPWGVAWLDGTAYVTERDSGRLLAIEGGDVREVQRFDVDPTGEGGLLGLASHEGMLYAYLTASDGNRVVRFRPGEQPETIVDGIRSSAIHNGGRLAFGPDGLLYIGTGDAGNAALAQDPDSLNGKILRVTPEGDVPADNPIAGSPVYSLGHRNVQGLAWSDDGTLYAAEFGPDRDDEINRIEAGGNYGWPEVTGNAGASRFVDPVAVRQPPNASWSGLAWHDGALWAASLRGNRLWRFDVAEDGTLGPGEDLLVDEYGRLRTAVTTPDGALWVTTSNRDGRGSPVDTDDRIIRIPT